jgi:hypothetical protein
MSTFYNTAPQFLDENGNPYSGGRLYYGEANTDPKDNPQDIFLDEALTVPAANPQLLDAAGRASQGTIYMVGAPARYSMLLEDQFTNQVLNIPSAVGVAIPTDLSNIPAIVVQDSITIVSVTDAALIIDSGVGLGSVGELLYKESDISQWAWVRKAIIDGGSIVLRNIANGGGEPIEFPPLGGFLLRRLGVDKLISTATGLSVPAPIENSKQVIMVAGRFNNAGVAQSVTIGITSVTNIGAGTYTVVLDYFPAAEVDLVGGGSASLATVPMICNVFPGANASGTVIVNTQNSTTGALENADDFAFSLIDLGQVPIV